MKIIIIYHIYLIFIAIQKEEKVFGGTSESFGKQCNPGDIIGVFLDLTDHTISKKSSSIEYLTAKIPSILQ